MSQLIVDAAMQERLMGSNTRVTICNEAGEVLGHFTPAAAAEKAICFEPEDRCPYTPEELARMRRQRGGKTLSEIWRSLGVQ